MASAPTDTAVLASSTSMMPLSTSLLDHIFFFMLLPPPRSTLFPYTTLFRSIGVPVLLQLLVGGARHALYLQRHRGHAGLDRSEEHTSELQSHSDLVCRLL